MRQQKVQNFILHVRYNRWSKRLILFRHERQRSGKSTTNHSLEGRQQLNQELSGRESVKRQDKGLNDFSCRVNLSLILSFSSLCWSGIGFKCPSSLFSFFFSFLFRLTSGMFLVRKCPLFDISWFCLLDSFPFSRLTWTEILSVKRWVKAIAFWCQYWTKQETKGNAMKKEP